MLACCSELDNYDEEENEGEEQYYSNKIPGLFFTLERKDTFKYFRFIFSTI
jgi:hypothetical protein